jgi:hypothetical protein
MLAASFPMQKLGIVLGSPISSESRTIPVGRDYSAFL